ncbi:MAG: thioredoxin family protein [Alphaproteobacteria bacterium]|nr:thioredoxin family protein [Alphaproteobacteria bacterium]MCB9930532.1 thioredoxin family protein [Alphaproteobacteria bacterium]
MPLRFAILLIALLAAFPPVGGRAWAAASDWASSAEARARLVSATTAVGEQDHLRLGLEIALQPGWKTYWRSPGEGGYPPRLDWAKSDNLAGAEISWPAPKRFQILGIDSVGYEKHVIYPLTVTPERVGEAMVARLSLDYLTCSDICIPQHADLSLTLPAGPAAPSAEAFALDQARGRIPGPAVAGMALTSARLEPGQGKRWWLDLQTGAPLQQPDAFVEAADDAFAFGAPERLGPTRLRLPVLYADTDPKALVATPVTVTVTDGQHAFEQTVTVAAGGAPDTGVGDWGLILLVALAGGLILNLMPCVLPVLSIKVLSLVKHGGGEHGAARASFLATAAGILVSFGLLAAGAIGLREAGVAVGWGMQFQEAWFIAFMALVCVLFAANLWGLFEVPMPAAFGRLGHGQGGAFATGLFATLLATPCSAPFVGTAVAFALARGWVETLAIFLAMGVGLALPYLAIAVWPRFATRLPKPGRWMVRLRAVLGVALAATAVWLGTILLALNGVVAAAVLAGVAVVMLVWLWQVAARWRLPGAVLMLLAGVALPAALPSAHPADTAAKTTGVWQPFSQDRLASLVADGKTVLVDVTADWCITCQANKAAVLNRGEVAAILASGKVAALKADWTRPDAAIQAYLASFGRYGIPFNAVYGPKAPNGIPLPELLTEGAVMDAIGAAAR